MSIESEYHNKKVLRPLFQQHVKFEKCDFDGITPIPLYCTYFTVKTDVNLGYILFPRNTVHLKRFKKIEKLGDKIREGIRLP
jgi:hypothetical protein